MVARRRNAMGAHARRDASAPPQQASVSERRNARWVVPPHPLPHLLMSNIRTTPGCMTSPSQRPQRWLCSRSTFVKAFTR
ncbi:hypothetical protein J6590_015508 [Homalodisca vitripennis]|nr:hypothetical protein J6590_015508 [Homalodisca vitripennis]